MLQPRTLWTPDADSTGQSNLSKYVGWLSEHRGLHVASYADLWQWSTENPADFWESIAAWFEVRFHTPAKRIMSDDPMPHTQWFQGATLNYAEHIFRNKTAQRPALIFASERQKPVQLSWDELEAQTASLQQYLRKSGVKPGDRVAAYIPNIPQATVSMLATISLGAVWSSCSPDFGSGSVLDRFQQIEPKIFITVDGYTYNGKEHNRLDTVSQIAQSLPTVEKVICIPYLNEDADFAGVASAMLWQDIVQERAAKLTFEPVPFSHPIWILYSSGTTGSPKAITHGHGGMLLEHLKYLSLHNDVREGERFFWYSTTGWMMWNFVHASLLVGATMVLYDGGAAYPALDTLWALCAALPIHHFGTSAPFLVACMKANLQPAEQFDLSALRSIGSTGSPLPPEAFTYVYEHIKSRVWLCSMSGGTDICTAWVGGNPWLPVRAGEIQCRTLGCAMFAFDEHGSVVYDDVGEMVVTQAMPCMPVFFWNDPDFERYTESYFEMYQGVWRHGDWVKITAEGSVVILGRSDTTLNRQGIRIGTAEIYRAVDKIDSVKDSLVVNIERQGGGDYMPLFIVMKEGHSYSEEIGKAIAQQIRKECSPRHVPDEIIPVPDIPYTISGKKMEAPVKKILLGIAESKAANKGAMRNPESLEVFVRFAAR